MTPRKRKSPKGKKQVREPGILVRLLQAGAAAAGRHPRLLAGVSSFAVVFGFVSANALWYQPGDHPSPLLATRDARDPNAIAGYRPAPRTPPEEVTTFRISREDPAGPAAGGLPATNEPAVPEGLPEAQQAGVAERDLVAAVQRHLNRRGLYNGAADGVPGPQTSAAILFFQETEGMAQTGEASAELLAALQASPAAAVETAAVEPRPLPVEAVAVPASRPAEDVSASVEDPVAAAIRASETGRPPAAKAPPRDLGPAIAASADLVVQIQRGLSNIAYTDITVDGVAGAQTRAAIRRFEKHYRLPETGEPNELVLKKLKSIGAL